MLHIKCPHCGLRSQNEFVYGGCPANGYAQMSITLQAKAYGAKATFFMAKRSMDNLHEYQKKALDYGADIRWVPNGMLQVTKKRALDYYNEDPVNRRLLQLGLKTTFKVKDNPLPWLEWILNGADHTNFFENRVTEYEVAGLSGSWETVYQH